MTEIQSHPDKVEVFTNGPGTVTVYWKGDERMPCLDCSECRSLPCEHTGGDFTPTGLMSGIFTKKTLKKESKGA